MVDGDVGGVGGGDGGMCGGSEGGVSVVSVLLGGGWWLVRGRGWLVGAGLEMVCGCSTE